MFRQSIVILIIVITTTITYARYVQIPLNEVVIFEDSILVPINNLEYNPENESNQHLIRQRRQVIDPLDLYSEYNSRDYDRQDTKYHYTPLFKYRATQHKRKKLFVPNLWG